MPRGGARPGAGRKPATAIPQQVAPRPRGRPSTYTPEVGEQICALHANGTLLSHICRDNEWAPERPATIWKWADQHPEFATKLFAARMACGDEMAAQILDIAKEERDPIRARVMVDARRWLASKYNPGRFGDKLEVAVTPGISLIDALAAARQRLDYLHDERPQLTGEVRPVEKSEHVKLDLDFME